MKKAWVYLLECADGTFYTRNTDHLKQRLFQHQIGEGCSYTKARLPVKLVFCQFLPSKEDAYMAEQQLKGWSSAKKIALINGDWELIKYLAKKPKYRK
ncbi:MAG: GIY-YIG nuclease family protein [Anaerolineales bacterium]